MSAKGAAAKGKAKKKPAPKKEAAKKAPPPKKKAAPPPKPASKKNKITKKPAAKKKVVAKTTAKKAPPPKVAPKVAPKVKAKPEKTPKVVAKKAPPEKKPLKPVPEVKAKEPKNAAPPPVVVKENPVSEQLNAPAKKPGVLRVARGERRPTRGNEKKQDPVEKARAALAKVGMPENGEVKKQGKIVEINPKLESSRDKIESKPEMPGKPPSVAERKRQEAEAAFQKVAPKHNELTHHFHKSPFDVRISERDSLATQIRMSGSHDEALRAARELAERYRLPPDQVTLVRIVELGDERLTKLALEELLELDDKGRVRPTSDLITTVTAIRTKDAETIELKDLLLEKVRPR